MSNGSKRWSTYLCKALYKYNILIEKVQTLQRLLQRNVWVNHGVKCGTRGFKVSWTSSEDNSCLGRPLSSTDDYTCGIKSLTNHPRNTEKFSQGWEEEKTSISARWKIDAAPWQSACSFCNFHSQLSHKKQHVRSPPSPPSPLLACEIFFCSFKWIFKGRKLHWINAVNKKYL